MVLIYMGENAYTEYLRWSYDGEHIGESSHKTVPTRF